MELFNISNGFVTIFKPGSLSNYIILYTKKNEFFYLRKKKKTRQTIKQKNISKPYALIKPVLKLLDEKVALVAILIATA